MANYKSKYSGEEVDAILDMSKRNYKKNTLLIRGAPHNTTKGSVGQLAIDTYTGYNHVYKCVAVNEDGTYIWENIDHPSKNNFYIKDIDMEWGTEEHKEEYEAIGVSGGLLHDEKYEVKLEMFLNNEVVFTTESWCEKFPGGICIYDPVSEVKLYTIYDDSLVEDEPGLLDIEYDAWKLTLKGVGWVYAFEYNSQVVWNEIENNSILPMHISYNAKRDIASYVKDSKIIPYTKNIIDGQAEGSLYTADAIPDNLGLGAFAGGYKGQATADYSATSGYGSVVGAKGYKINDISVDIPERIIRLKLNNLKDEDTNENACPQLKVGAKCRFLRKEYDILSGDRIWDITAESEIATVNEDTTAVEINDGRGVISTDTEWNVDIVPLLMLDLSEFPNSPWNVLSAEYAKKCLGDVFCFGPDAYALTAEQITDLTSKGIKVGSGSRGISTGHFGTVLGKYGFSYNNRGRSIGESSKCGGQECWARGGGSDVHGLQCQTMPDARHSFVRGGYNIVYGAFAASLGIGNHVYTLGGFGRGTYGEKDTAGKYLDFIGIGSDDSRRQNGYTFDKQGNVWFKGSIKIGGTSFDDEDASTVATLADLKDIPAPDMSGYATTADIDNIMAEIIEVQKAIVGGEL